MCISNITIAEWINKGKNIGAAYLIIACDTFDYMDYPVYVMPNENLNDKLIYYSDNTAMRAYHEVHELNIQPKFHMNLRTNIKKPNRLTY
ncbi:hypothetical protein QKU48_gp0411 [Fadolivirus algeromassiliense]|jgi:hypothetical protein|uniref:Uncharacterized protein n=1 Tax=Fadolivirus FV1/VV64 TaxID=3070911 RepID=A0A7D3UV36_9VIRU|nr:hypothetical protein QKU48_gp0411 [Fadolivirus algeromassiliense]QKF93869.1 hypothetical protein Fadolivirus_1_411 [Fadolivirus FV1/VV64]